MYRVFISYRRDDSHEAVGRISDNLVSHLGKHRVFMDVDTIPAGVDFRQEIRRFISGSDVVLVVIGPRWTTLVDDAGTPRIADPDDFVRLEVEQALVCGAKVIPILVNGATVPEPSGLPESVRPLCYLNAIHVRRDPDFSGDMRKLTREILQQTTSGWHIVRALGISTLAGVVFLSCNLPWFRALFRVPGRTSVKVFTAWKSPFALFELPLTGHLMVLCVAILAAVSWPRRFTMRPSYLGIAAPLLFFCMMYCTFPIALDMFTPDFKVGLALSQFDGLHFRVFKGPRLCFSTGDGPPLAACAIAGMAFLICKQSNLPVRSRRWLRWAFAILAVGAVASGMGFAYALARAYNGTAHVHWATW
jgi:hypothetical protein